MLAAYDRAQPNDPGTTKVPESFALHSFDKPFITESLFLLTPTFREHSLVAA
jgi:hypothetical protein